MNTKARICEQLYHQHGSELYIEPDVHKKAEAFQKTMCCTVNEICPPRKICVREDNPKWETDLLSFSRYQRSSEFHHCPKV